MIPYYNSKCYDFLEGVGEKYFPPFVVPAKTVAAAAHPNACFALFAQIQLS